MNLPLIQLIKVSAARTHHRHHHVGGAISMFKRAKSTSATPPTPPPPQSSSWIVERKFPAPLSRPDRPPSLRRRHNVYLEVNRKPQPFWTENVKILLTQYVEGLGRPGEQIELNARKGRELLLMKKGVYPTEENVEKYCQVEEVSSFSSKYVKETLDQLRKTTLFITMNKDNPWTLNPTHISVCFRKAHIIVPPSAITMSKDEIKGPDMSLEGKEFYVVVKINKTEETPVRCRLHHWATNKSERLPWTPFPWMKEAELIFSEDKEIKDKLPPIETIDLDEDEMHDAISKLRAKAVARKRI